MPEPRSSTSGNIPTSFEGDALRSYIRKLLDTNLQNVEFDKEKTRLHGKELSSDYQRIKARMTELNPHGWKFAVVIQINQNLGQGGRADLATHWAATDLCIQELWSNEHLLCACFAFAIKA